MFEIELSEVVLLTMIGLLVLGPKRWPKLVGEIGKWAGSARRTAARLLRQLERETGFVRKPVEWPRPKLRLVRRSRGAPPVAAESRERNQA